jgi:signal transduction histidine kinase
MLHTDTRTGTGDDRASSLRSQLAPVVWGDGAQAEAVNVTACLADIEALIQTMWGPKIRFDLSASGDLPLLTCDGANLQAAIMNLLLNARDAMPDGGAISVVATAIHDGYSAIELRVADNGLGMNEDTVRRAADPFFTTKSTGLGGLGLPMVKRFVQEAGGRLHIESQPGVGTSVTLLLPLSI